MNASECAATEFKIDANDVTGMSCKTAPKLHVSPGRAPDERLDVRLDFDRPKFGDDDLGEDVRDWTKRLGQSFLEDGASDAAEAPSLSELDCGAKRGPRSRG